MGTADYRGCERRKALCHGKNPNRKDGRISDFKIVRPSGNVVVDESIQAVGKRVTRVDALPTGIGNGGHYDVNINFALNSK